MARLRAALGRHPFETILAVSLIAGLAVAVWPIADKSGRLLAWAQGPKERCESVPTYAEDYIEPSEEMPAPNIPLWIDIDSHGEVSLDARLYRVSYHNRYGDSTIRPRYDPQGELSTWSRRIALLRSWSTEFGGPGPWVVDGTTYTQRRWDFARHQWVARYRSGMEEVCTAIPIPPILLRPAIVEGAAVAAGVYFIAVGLVLSRRALGRPPRS